MAHQTLKTVLATKQSIKKQSIQRFGSAETNDVCTKKANYITRKEINMAAKKKAKKKVAAKKKK